MSKIFSLKNLLVETKKSKSAKKKAVLVTGCFDVLHRAHINFLKQAKKQGDILLVGLETDKRVKELKGKNRPINNWAKRADNLNKIKEISYIFPLSEDLGKKEIQEMLITQLKPDVLAVSSHTPNIDRKKYIVQKYGGRLKIVFSHNPHFSTTKILGKII